MNKELKRVSFVVLAMFVALFLSTSLIQVGFADALKADGRNARTLYASYSVERGAITVDGQPIAQSVPSGDQYKFQRTYPGGPMYAPVTGFVALFGEPTGIEGALNDYLSGRANEQFLDQINSIITGQSPKGASVELTIDPVVQQAAWDALGDNEGAVIAIDPTTGAILAMVSKPSFDPNALAVHDTELVQELYQQLLDDPNSPLINRTIRGDLDPPGSTFKVVVTATALERGLPPDTQFPNPPTLLLPGTDSTIRNSGGDDCGGGATVSIADALRLSCNVPFAQIGLQLGGRAIFEQAEKFGFGEQFRIPMLTEASEYPRALDDPQLMLSAFGQGSVRVTPLQMAMVSAGVANGGIVMNPTLVESVTAPDLRVIDELTPSEFGRALSQENAITLTQLMVQNVSNGAGSNASIDGVEVAGKTGTAENGEDEPYTLWFTGFAPASAPEVAVAVVVQNGGGQGQNGTGNGLAAPIAKAVMEAVLSR
jgi:peptidoglycan glycosyltransferase